MTQERTGLIVDTRIAIGCVARWIVPDHPTKDLANGLPNKPTGWTVLMVGAPMTIRGHSSFEARQLVLFGAAAIVVLIFVWTLVL